MEEMPVHLLRYDSAQVTIYYSTTSSYSDTGKITFMDANWVELTKGNNECLLIPVVAIRLIKLLEAAPVTGEAAMLLRPADGQLPEGEKATSYLEAPPRTDFSK